VGFLGPAELLSERGRPEVDQPTLLNGSVLAVLVEREPVHGALGGVRISSSSTWWAA